MRSSLLVLGLLWLNLGFFSSSLEAQKIAHKVFLTGNFADLSPETAFYSHLESYLENTEAPFTLIINGDLKMPGKDNWTVLSKRDPLIDLFEKINASENGRVIIVPGDRDWNDSKKGGFKAVMKLQDEIESLGLEKVHWAVPDGCPGPKLIQLDDHLVVIAMNTQWWNHPFDKPHADDAQCKIISTEDFVDAVDDLIEENRQKNIILAGHYPVVSYGNYGGHFSFGQHLLPLPILGEFRTAFQSNVGGPKNISNQAFEPFVHGIKTIYYQRQGLIYMSAHEKNQQVIRKRDDWYLNSGAPESAGYATHGDGVVLSVSIPGIMMVDFNEDASVNTKLLKYTAEAGFSEGDKIPLYQGLCNYRPFLYETPISRAAEYCTPENLEPIAPVSIPGETVPQTGGAEYHKSKFSQIFLGSHWRKSWVTPVQTPYLNLDTAYGGLTVFEKGGGRQTTSLKLNAADGTQYVFRSINKDPERALDYTLRKTIITKIVKDATSTQHPYGALVVDPLLNRLDILHAHPKLYVLPDVPQLGLYQEKYAGLFGMLEDKPGKSNDRGEKFAGADKIVQSNKLFRLLYSSQKNSVDQQNYVRARLFDMWLGDWSKHQDNWKWAGYKIDGRMLYKPIPRDRDHVFSQWDGFLYWILDREWGMGTVQHFGKKYKGIKTLNGQMKHIDRFISNEKTRKEWVAEAKYIQLHISAQNIEEAVRTIPQESYESSGEEIEKKLKLRIDKLDKLASKYYGMIAKEVEVVGSGKKDYFEIRRNEDGSVLVLLYDKKADNPDRVKTYERTFSPDETKEIRLYGLAGDDEFLLSGEGKRSIRIRIISGSGNDKVLEDEHASGKSGKVFVYDMGEGMANSPGTRRVKTWNKDLYYYKFSRFQYNSYLPLISLSYSRFNGFTGGAGISYTFKKWGKQDYASRHRIFFNTSSVGNKGVSYAGRFHHVFRKWDVEIGAGLKSPEYHNRFFGNGNETVLDPAVFSNTDYYEIEYNRTHLQLGLATGFWKKSMFSLGIMGERVSIMSDTVANILGEDPGLLGVDKALILVGPYLKLDLDMRDNSGLPNKGIRTFFSYSNRFAVNDDFSNFGMVTAFLEYYATLALKKPLTIGLRVGGAKSHGEVPFYKSVYLGSNENLRGYNNRRFSGDGNLYLNTEVRWELYSRKESLVPLRFGLKGFYDIGKVYNADQHSKVWHSGYGGGIYISPFNQRLTLSVNLAFSEEESFYPLIRFGTSF